ncbi:NfeD family protein [Ferrovibrio terrae]|uniref:NfeD family protein n=1 Tax=Ferrovibrio terrae TaxID=2594003 RepID=UPI0031381582
MPFTLLAWHWLAAGLILVVLEVVVSGNILIWLGLPALAVGAILLAVPELSLAMQLGLYGILAVLALGCGLLLRRRRSTGEQTVNTGTARLIGQHAVLSSALQAGRGEIQLGDSFWPVSGPDLPAGTEVVIVAADGVVLQVEPKA